MNLCINVSLAYELGAERTALLAVEAAKTQGQVVVEDQLDIDDAEITVIEGEGGVGQRNWTRVTTDVIQLRYRAKVCVSRPPARLKNLASTPLRELPSEQVTFLRPSRFCQSDQIEPFVAHHFGHLSGGEKIMAIVDWMAAEMAYDPAYSNSDTTFLDTFVKRRGVCRDFAGRYRSRAIGAGRANGTRRQAPRNGHTQRAAGAWGCLSGSHCHRS